MSSPDTPKGSISKDLNLSKLWLCSKLESYDFDNVYVLGSWYGSMGLFLVNKHIKFDHVYSIDWSHEKTEYAAHVLKRMHLNNKVHAVCHDVNKIDYQGRRILVINTSTNDIKGRQWFDSIPRGSVVALQGRDNQDVSNGVETLSRFSTVYPLSSVDYLGKLRLDDVQGNMYHRFMKIGIK